MNRDWIRKVWANERIGLWKKVRASVVLFFDLYEETSYPDEQDIVAWNDEGFVHTDCGDGRAYELCSVHGWRYQVWSDTTI